MRVHGDIIPCEYPDCDKICKSKAGLTIHQRMMHQKARATFTCNKYEETFTEGKMKNHEKRCMGKRSAHQNTTICGTCGKDISKANIARHRRTREARAGVAGIEWRKQGRHDGGEDEDQTRARVYVDDDLLHMQPDKICSKPRKTHAGM